MALFDTTGFRILEEGLQIVNQTQRVIEQNIVNQDTPGYKCKYVYFSGVLRDKLNASEDTKFKKELHLSSYIYTDDNTYDQPDGNNVDNDTQQALFVKNALLQDALINQMNSEFTLMRTAMSRN
ncbi:MAG: flagellar basal body rod protein FlgB [Ruminococcaceae bacterium]|nr:flagellar basal body rod protein FlgB [Oscillospiraceae bacterium]